MKKFAHLALPLVAAAVAAPVVSSQAAGTAHAAGSEQTITAYTTGYTWFDNTPVGSAQIAHPVLHSVAGGTGTYADPITLATASGAYAAGTRFYVPSLHRYFIAEDIGGSNMYNPPSGASSWLDLWIGGAGGTASGADDCASAITGNHTVIVNPRAGYAVQAGTIYTGVCHGGFSDQATAGATTSTTVTVKKVTVRRATAVTPTKKATAQKATAAKRTAVAAHQTYVVKAGDTLSAIARAHHTTWQKLWQLNKNTLKNPNMLKIGQKIVLG